MMSEHRRGELKSLSFFLHFLLLFFFFFSLAFFISCLSLSLSIGRGRRWGFKALLHGPKALLHIGNIPFWSSNLWIFGFQPKSLVIISPGTKSKHNLKNTPTSTVLKFLTPVLQKHSNF